MSARQTIPSEMRTVLEEILEILQLADAVANANEKGAETPFAYVAGYLGATIKHQVAKIERLLEAYAPAEKAKTP